jgi:hypothetical protein
MPEIARFFGIVIAMYYRDHPPPHFHAEYGSFGAQIQIDPPGLLRGNLPPRALSMVIEWTALHRDELLANWERLRQRQPLVRIPGLE